MRTPASGFPASTIPGAASPPGESRCAFPANNQVVSNGELVAVKEDRSTDKIPPLATRSRYTAHLPDGPGGGRVRCDSGPVAGRFPVTYYVEKGRKAQGQLTMGQKPLRCSSSFQRKVTVINTPIPSTPRCAPPTSSLAAWRTPPVTISH